MNSTQQEAIVRIAEATNQTAEEVRAVFLKAPVEELRSVRNYANAVSVYAKVKVPDWAEGGKPDPVTYELVATTALVSKFFGGAPAADFSELADELEAQLQAA